MYQSVFLSYGGPDEQLAERVASALREHGVSVWFFPDSSVPGAKLHRTMSWGVRNHDKVLLICSKHSLSRPGVLNELEQVLMHEASCGGEEKVIPLAIDDHIYSWNPQREDLAGQLKSRVIEELYSPSEEDSFRRAITRILVALRKQGV